MSQISERAPPQTNWQLAGIVLCGGESRRMGRSKAWLPFGSETVLARIIGYVKRVAPSVVVVHRPGQELPPVPYAVQWVADKFVGHGPLAGLHAGLLAVRDQATHALVVSCDVPLVRAEFLLRLWECMKQATMESYGGQAVPLACVPVYEERKHPLVAIYAVRVWPIVESLLRAGRLRPAFLLEQIPVRWVFSEEWADVDAQTLSLFNINTPEEYEAALQLAGLATDGESAWEASGR
ncbi:MAG: molybdenum cofactor guanylyltransferase [Gemmatales bacterium]|nr:molybdenum cofactor guanylyltransferase [Gemmatales bacterium]MDW7993320.1 molybdenum cofactor guanylyltransferase [Gemmatales bacterium]